jgi:hypothetical protein
MGEIPESSPRQEVFLDVFDPRFDFSLRLWPIRATEPGRIIMDPQNLDKKTGGL